MLKTGVRYSFTEEPEGTFKLYQGSTYLVTFTRLNLRESFELVADTHQLSSHWIGSILRLFHKQFPSPIHHSDRSDAQRLLVKYGEEGLTDILRERGFRISRIFDVPEEQIIRILEERGFHVEGLIGDVYYQTDFLRPVLSNTGRKSATAETGPRHD